jgi:hypothetical protein
MVERAVPFRIPAPQPEKLAARQAVHPDTLCRHSHPREAVEELIRL